MSRYAITLLSIPCLALSLLAQNAPSQTAPATSSKATNSQPAIPKKGPGVVESGVFHVDPQTAAAFPRFALRNPRYLLRPGDVVNLTFPYTPDFNQVVSVQPDGFVTLRDLPDLKISGMDLPKFRETVQRAYANVLREPVVNVDLKEFEKPFFIASGQVGRPGKYDLSGDLTVSEAVAIAGGFTEASKHSNVLLLRRVSEDQVMAVRVDVKKMLASGDVREDLHIQPGDMLFVPQNLASKLKSFLNPRLSMAPSLNPSKY